MQLKFLNKKNRSKDRVSHILIVIIYVLLVGMKLF